METRFTRPERNKDVSEPSSCELSIFSQQVRVFGGQRNHKLPYALRQKAHWYILNNCKEVEVYKNEHLHILSTKVSSNLIFQHHELEFPQWFREKMLLYRERILLDFCELFIGTQMPPKRVQDLPGLSFGDGNHSTSDVDSSLCIRSKRRDTRATHSDMLRNLIERQGKILVTFRKVDGHPSGQYAAAFMTELGPNSIRKETDKLMNARYRDNRCKMHDHYLALVHLPWERQLMDVPFDYCDTVKDWEFMCTLFESEAFKRRSKANKENRSKLLNNHRGGSKSFIRHSYDGTKRKDRITVYGYTHFSLKNGWIGSTKAIYEHMVQLRDDYKDKQMETGGSKPLTDLEISAIVCDEFLRMRPGYIRGMGNGPKPATWMFYDASSNQPTNEELKNELQATQDELKYVRAEQEMMKEAFEKIFPGALQSMFRHSSSIAPSPSPPTAI
ncbi:hypothetical protein C2S51_007632 [Perilla frutescens var. frutescens]|nr:hypothetical protein C2S51_007632 [Perilla frutescens var. frutescens]